MKTLLLFTALLFAITLGSSLTPAVGNAATPIKKDKAVITFEQPVQLMGLTLKGEYLFVHDDAAMVTQNACTFVYRGRSENINNLVISFHCTPAMRARVANFTVRSVETWPGHSEIREFQFAGSTEAHLLPSGMNPDYVMIAN